MKEITLTINDKQVKGKEGDTVLEICQANGIDVPTLCHLDGLTDVGACRMCVVDIEGERRPVPSCTYPARDGQVVRTDSEHLEKYRRQILELLFTERNHFCMFCEQSGDCELQRLAYRYQMDNVRYPYHFPSLPVDTLSDHLVIEHNRCVLCGRCIRTCNEIAANFTLDFGGRGWQTMVVADLDQPVSESSCTSCGACVQACPTGAIFSRLSAYRGVPSECERVTTVCPACGVGCKLDVLVKDNNIVRIEAPALTSPKGPLCKEGRFGLLPQTRSRVTSPLVRGKHGRLEECSLDTAAEAVAKALKDSKDSFGGIASPQLPSETLAMFNTFMREAVGSDLIDTIDGDSCRVISEGIRQFGGNGKGLDVECPIEVILEADLVLVVGADPDRTNPIVGNLVRRAVRQKGARLVVVDSSRNVFLLWTDLWLKPREGSEDSVVKGLLRLLIDKGLAAPERLTAELTKSLKQYAAPEVTRATAVDEESLEAAAKLYGEAERAVIVYGQSLLKQNDPSTVTALLNMAEVTENRAGDNLRVISLKPGANSRGAWELGVASRDVRQNGLKGVYLLLGDQKDDDELFEWLKGIDFIAVQASYHSPTTTIADVVLPSPIWAEREGKYVSMDGATQELGRVLEPPEGVPGDQETLQAVSRKLGHELSLSQEVNVGKG
ncbi:MAG: molybdopterin-dependent oxidoreductase [Chloroflexota bacterium]|nr:molybdopterin-dependent oxidoreductase [Chloroflexota bacterium]